MTNALAQNIQANENSSAIDAIMQAASINTLPKAEEHGDFSNIINNLESKTQKLQSDFDKKAKVTNTSSINQKALDKKETITPKETEKNIQNTEETFKNTKETSEYTQTKEINSSEAKKIVKKENKDFKATNSQTVSNETETKAIKEIEDLSDINNSSPVESSPVFSSDDKNAAEEEIKIQLENTLNNIELNVEKLANNILVTNDEIKAEIKDIAQTLENIENLQDIDEIINKIENISSNLDNSTLNQEQKTELTNVLNEIKNLLKNSEKIVEQPNNFKNLISDLKDKLSQSIKTIEINFDETSKHNIQNENIKVIPEIKNNKEDINEIANDIKKITEEIKNTISNFNSEKIDEFNEKLNETVEKIEILNKTQESNKEINLENNIVESLKNLKNLLKEALKTTETTEIKENIVEINSENKNVIFETLDKLTSDDFKNIDLKDEKTTKEIIALLDNLNKEIEEQELDKEIKTEIENLVQKINQKEISSDDLTQAIDTLTNEIKIDSSKTQNTNQEPKNIVEFSKENIKTQADIQQNLNQEQNQQDLKSNKTQEIEIADLGTDEINADFNEIKLEANISKDSSVKQIDTKNIEENLQKTLAINEMLDEMMVEVNIKTIPSQSGALSVADEITKLAMGETNSLNSISSTTGSITYDSTGLNALIKNVANLTKTTQAQNINAPSMEDVLNQVVNKIGQLKDTNAQKLTMILRPNDLGRLSIELTSNQNGLTTQIMAQNEDVRAYIEKNIDSLRQQLANSGVNVNSIQIKTAGSDNTTTYDGNQNLNNNFEQENLNQQNNKDSKNNQQNNDNKDAKEILTTISNYDMSFAKDFSSILNKSLSYGN